MPKKEVVVELSRSRLTLAVVRGRGVADLRTQRLSPAEGADWAATLAEAKPKLTALVAELGVSGAEATILYTSPTAATGVFSCPVAAGKGQAERAARLALGESATFPLASNPHDLWPLATDTDSKAAGKQRQAHTLGIADTDGSAQALTDCATSAGLNPRRQIPRDIVSLVTAIDRALEGSKGGQVAVALYTGEHESVLAAASDGRLCFVRQLAVGVETFVDALSGRMGASDQGAASDDPHAAAATMLFKVGIPTRDQATSEGPQSPAAIALPLFQPILQRFIVDLKQSLRFGLEEQERGSAKLVGMGPGARIPRLLEVIAEQTGLKHEPADGSAPGDEPGAIKDWQSLRPVGANLLPRALSVALSNKRVTRGLWVGTAAAILLLGAGAVMSRADLKQARDQTAKVKARLEGVKPATELSAKLAAAQGGLAGAKHRIEARLGAGGEWDAVLAMLSSGTPQSIRLTEAQFAVVQGKPTCRLIGYAAVGTQAEANTALQNYLNTLAGVPIVRSCRLGSTQWVENNAGHRENFEASLTLVELPAQSQSAARIVTSAPTEDRP